MMNNISFTNYESSRILVKNFVKEVSDILKDEITKKNSATLLVSGGSTPKLFFQELSKVEIQWEKVKIGLVDERWLLSSNKDSNAYLVKKHLLQNEAKNAKFIPLFIKDKECFSSDDLCSDIYEKEFLKCDILILGMGNDGHTASLFPQSKKLDEALDLNTNKFCISINPLTAPYDRMSLTLKSILNSKNIFLHIQKVEKLKVYKEALEKENKYPISKVLFNAKKIKVYYSHE